ncbi:MAG: hypothetical protein H7269_15640 [Cellulomonas sp.]|nr:hypothetical protein [Cellulomonas sp.]
MTPPANGAPVTGTDLGSATVTYVNHLTVSDLIAVVNDAGYIATVPARPAVPTNLTDPSATQLTPPDPVDALRQRLVFSAVLTVPVLVVAMIPAAQFDKWQWLSLTLAAFGWSLWALFAGDAGMPGLRMAFTFSTARGEGSEHIHLAIASTRTVVILLGVYFEAHARRCSGAALHALLELGAKDVAIDAALLTAEAAPIEVAPGDTVIGATVNTGGHLVVRATRVGVDTQIARLVVDAQSGKAAVQRLADRVSGVFVPVVVYLSVATEMFWHEELVGLPGGVGVREVDSKQRVRT